MQINSKANIILLAGGSGLIGRGLIKYLISLNYKIRVLSRRNISIEGVDCYLWNPETRFIDLNALKDKPIIINLAGSSIADKPWTRKRKNEILSSRINAIKTIELGLLKSGCTPELIICTSAIGIYGDRPETILNEESQTVSSDFLSATVHSIEEATHPLVDLSERIVLIRIGLYLSTNGGIWPKLNAGKKLRLLFWFGNGNQIYSWIHEDDFNHAIAFIINDNNIKGVVNLCAPEPSSNKAILINIKNKLKGFSFCFGIPRFILKLILQEMSNLLLFSQHVIPTKLLNNGFVYKYQNITEAVNNLINQKNNQ
ncbi:MAG: TIGR01777 family oxidoreductase [Saprospiraceae bacterium]